MFKLLFGIVFVAALPAFVAAQSGPAIDMVVVRPKESDEVLVNPGMGITTFQRFNGQPLNEGLKWSEEGPVKREAAVAPRHKFPVASIAYCRWFWGELQPAPETTRWEIIDTALEEARRHNQTLAIRLMPYDDTHPLPAWYQRSGAKRANSPAAKDGTIWQPDFGDPLYQKYWGAFVAAAGARYDGHPFLESVDISSVGYWGEGWSDYMPEFAVQQRLTDIYFDAFRRTPLLMNFDEPRALAYGTNRGAGWRLDCLGDMGGQWKDRPAFSHMLDLYPQQIVRTKIQDVWRRSPVSLETCWVPQFWKDKGWDVDEILGQALRWHVSSLNVKSSVIPPEWEEKFAEFQKKMAYRFVLKRFAAPREARTGRMIPLQMWWRNAGVAPIYREYQLAVQFRRGEQSEIVRLPVDVREWLPGDAVYDGNVFVPETLRPGTYAVRVALLDPRTNAPAVRLAIEGREADGWYAVGSINITD